MSSSRLIFANGLRSDLERISRVSWSTSPEGLYAPATSGPRPYTWAHVLGGAPPEAKRLFIGKLNASSMFGLTTDTVTLLDYSAMMLRGRSNPYTSKRLLTFAACMRMDHFVFLAVLGHASSEETQEDLLLELKDGIAGVTDTVRPVRALARIRAQLGEHAGNPSVAPHYVADVVAQLGVGTSIQVFGV